MKNLLRNSDKNLFSFGGKISMMRVMKSQFKFKKKTLAFCLFVLSIFLVYGVYASSYEEVSKSTATIAHVGAFGSGFFIDKNLLVTAYYVVDDAKDGVVSIKTHGDIEDVGKVVVSDAESGLAIIRTLSSDYQALEMGSDERAKMGDEIFVIGNHRGHGISFSTGIISANRGDRLQMTAPISPGSSGSPVFSKDFKVIGIADSSDNEGQNLNFAIPVSKLRNLIQENKMVLGITETEEAVEPSESSFDEELASYENNEDKTPQELFDLGRAYAMGIGVAKDYKKAVDWYKKAANQGHARAQYNLGEMYEYGNGVAQDYKKAVFWYKKAANQGHADAQNNLGFMYSEGIGVEQDDKEAVSWYQKAANQGNAAGQENLGWMYKRGKGVAKDYKKAVYWLEKAANQGSVALQYNLGGMYHEGDGVAKDYKKAASWYQKAANQGDADTQENLRLTYEKAAGYGDVDDQENIRLMHKKAVDQGDAGAQENIRLVHKKAIGQGDVDAQENLRLMYEKAANQGNASAQNNLGVMYKRGEGIAEDSKKAIYWLEKAANQGHADAQYNLGLMYKKGDGVVQDYEKAVYWLEKAANQEYADAPKNLRLTK